jgi:hypothetical protein
MAYASDATGRNEIYLQSFLDAQGPGPAIFGKRVRVSINGGDFPSWRRDGKQLFFISPDGKLMAVDVGLGIAAAVGFPQALFTLPKRTSAYVPLPDGQRFLVSTISGEPPPATVSVVLNWATGLK